MTDDKFSEMPESEANWSSLSFCDLEAAYHKSVQPGDPGFALRIRYGNIMNFVDSDRIWPPTAPIKAKFVPAFCEVLSRLPSDVFSRVVDEISIVVEMPALQMLAGNVPPLSHAPPGTCPATIVFFHPCWKLSSKALIGLVAHEIAHSFVSGRDYKQDENLANQQTTDWGFGEELRLLEKEKELTSPADPG